VTAFHPDYKMIGHGHTRVERLSRAAQIGRAAGLRFVYAGNAPGQVGGLEHTACPGCGTVLVERWGFRVLRNRLAATGGRCPVCTRVIPGIWT
jgi:pyruvate formate lyase activating enzyme